MWGSSLSLYGRVRRQDYYRNWRRQLHLGAEAEDPSLAAVEEVLSVLEVNSDLAEVVVAEAGAAEHLQLR